jgi:tetratricopeptide (TPR) repeat protein
VSWLWRWLISVALISAAGWVAVRWNSGGPARPALAALAPIPARLAGIDYATSVREADAAIAALAPVAANDNGDWTRLERLASAYLARARLTGAYGDYVQARAIADSAFPLAVKGSGPLQVRATIALATHRLADAEPDVAAMDRFVVPTRQNRAEAKAMHGDIAFYRGQYNEAARLYEQARAIDLWSGLAYRQALLASRTGRIEDARYFYHEADSLERFPTPASRAQILMRLGEIDLAHGDRKRALAQFVEANRLYPGAPRTRLRLAQMAALKGDPSVAIPELERLATETGITEIKDILARLYRHLGDEAKARSWAAKAKAAWQEKLALIPESAWGHALEHELALGDPRLALTMAQKNARLRPHGDSLLPLAEAWTANKRPDLALKLLDGIDRSGWVSAQQHLARAAALKALGRDDAAKAAEQAALAINPYARDPNPAVWWLDH